MARHTHCWQTQTLSRSLPHDTDLTKLPISPLCSSSLFSPSTPSLSPPTFFQVRFKYEDKLWIIEFLISSMVGSMAAKLPMPCYFLLIFLFWVRHWPKVFEFGHENLDIRAYGMCRCSYLGLSSQILSPLIDAFFQVRFKYEDKLWIVALLISSIAWSMATKLPMPCDFLLIFYSGLGTGPKSLNSVTIIYI